MTTQTTIRFMKYYVTNGIHKARVSYSAFALKSTGQQCVTVYAKSYDDEKALQAMMPDLYENNSDAMTDYFEDGRARIVKGHPLYAAALERIELNSSKAVAGVH
ncbi:MAG: hypothetical protein PHS14_00430 [Elusimicrobia bacterium]|nr:hypothetical protein [Elusimicrobiota bacterium]